MCENNKELDTRNENKAMWADILAQYEQKNSNIYTEEDMSPLSGEFDGDDSIYSTEGSFAPQELMALVFLGTN